jgi:thioredoxin reductase (NADPH)
MLFLSRYARKVTVLIRGADADWSQYLDQSIRSNEKIEIRFNTEVVEIHGEDKIQEVVVHDRQDDTTQKLPAAAIFVFIGQKPQSDFVADLVLRTESGHILTGLDLVQGGKRPPGWTLNRDPLMLETSVPIAAATCATGRNMVWLLPAAMAMQPYSFWQYLSTICYCSGLWEKT